MDAVIPWIVARPELSHTLVGLALMALICPVLQLARLRGFAWHAAAYVSLFFYTREATEAERAWKPILGDPEAFLLTLWPGWWTRGGAHLSEWLVPTAAVLVAAWLTPAEPFIQRWPERLRAWLRRP